MALSTAASIPTRLCWVLVRQQDASRRRGEKSRGAEKVLISCVCREATRMAEAEGVAGQRVWAA
jgi:hypothetical protein